MAKLIVDSGATSAKWCLKSSHEVSRYVTEGLNPYHRSRESILNVVSNELAPRLEPETIEEVYFYGAGCDDNTSRSVVAGVLQRIFPNADIAVQLDLLGSARACFAHSPGIVCILGTGSNSCLYDGHNIVEHIPPLSYVLGDEGSAAYFGKKMINYYYRFKLPDELRNKLERSHNMELSYIQQHLYKGEQPSRFIASYAKFLGDHCNHPFVKKLLRKGFRTFINDLVKKYTNAGQYNISFVGSVAFAHQDLIKKTLQSEGLTPGIFLQNALDQLVEFHDT